MNAPQVQKYANVLANVSADTISKPILASDFKTVEFTLVVIATLNYINLIGGTFAVGDTVTQTTGAGTGTTGIIVSDNGVDEMTIKTIVPVGGGFANGETIDNGAGVTADISSLSLPNFDISVFESNGGIDEFTPPDPSQPVSPTNQYSDVDYLDKQGMASYNALTPYNPSADGTISKTFHVQTGGSRWIFIQLFNYATGVLSKIDVDLFSIL